MLGALVKQHMGSLKNNVYLNIDSLLLIPSWGHCVDYAHSPHSCMGFLQKLGFPPTPQESAREMNWHVYFVPVWAKREWVQVAL